MLQVLTSAPSGRQPLVLENVLASGGEGKIWSVQGNPRQLAKIYRNPTRDHGAKLKAMLANRPRDPGLSSGHVSLAWPQALLFDQQGDVIGFLMPALDRTLYVPLFKAYVPGQRQKKLPPGFTWEHLLRIACNIASVARALHARGYVLGDVLNESNILCDHRNALICLVDCDSLQVPRPGGGVFRCPVGKSEFSAPELQGVHFKQVDRQEAHDNFALAVLIFLLLMQAKHPFDGVPLGGMPALTLEERIKAGYCAYTGTPNFAPPPDGPSFSSVLTPHLQQLFRRCFVAGHRDPARRPSAAEWYQGLLDAEQQIALCTVSPLHIYLSSSQHCPWCELVGRGYPDLFAATITPPQPVVTAPLPLLGGQRQYKQPIVNAPMNVVGSTQPGQQPLARWVPTVTLVAQQPRTAAPWPGTPVTQQPAPMSSNWQPPYAYGPPASRRFPWPVLLVLLIIPALPICGILLYYLELILRATH